MNGTRFFFLGLVILAGACGRDAPPVADRSSGTSLTVHTTQRSAFQMVGGDTLSDSAQILSIHPEQDGDAIVTLFADPIRRVSAGLAIVDRKMAAPQLLWPDSVSNIWWPGAHTLAFTTATGDGIRLVIDIHAAELQVADTSARALAQPAALAVSDSAMIRRARTYTDSVRMQVAGAPQGSALTYAVTRLVPAADGRLAAFHTAARDTQGALTNPAWYALDRESGAVTPIDQVTGPVAELRPEAGQWSESGSFFYAKGRALWEAEVGRVTAGSP